MHAKQMPSTPNQRTYQATHKGLSFHKISMCMRRVETYILAKIPETMEDPMGWPKQKNEKVSDFYQVNDPNCYK